MKKESDEMNKGIVAKALILYGFVLSIALISMAFVHVWEHENKHADACREVGGVPTIHYQLLRGSVDCDNIPSNKVNLYIETQADFDKSERALGPIGTFAFIGLYVIGALVIVKVGVKYE